jgi:hypothetical protein
MRRAHPNVELVAAGLDHAVLETRTRGSGASVTDRPWGHGGVLLSRERSTARRPRGSAPTPRPRVAAGRRSGRGRITILHTDRDPGETLTQRRLTDAGNEADDDDRRERAPVSRERVSVDGTALKAKPNQRRERGRRDPISRHARQPRVDARAPPARKLTATSADRSVHPSARHGARFRSTARLSTSCLRPS